LLLYDSGHVFVVWFEIPHKVLIENCEIGDRRSVSNVVGDGELTVSHTCEDSHNTSKVHRLRPFYPVHLHR
jgi:hypothetical protein